MQIQTITYKQIKNLGNYQSAALEATAIVNEGEDLCECVEALKKFVIDQLYPEGPIPTPIVDEDDDDDDEGFF
ncbi:MAG: hypothetical protein QNJ51_27525 [Calothrix sp. MO_167.B12]|nr:hypothetical protein [Calothrix sp. MO_167.B12]